MSFSGQDLHLYYINKTSKVHYTLEWVKLITDTGAEFLKKKFCDDKLLLNLKPFKEIIRKFASAKNYF